MQKHWLTIFRVAFLTDLAARHQVSTPQSPKSEYHMRPTCSRFCLDNPSGVTISHSQRPDWPVHRRTSNSVRRRQFSFCICSIARFQICNQLSSGGRGYLKVQVDTVDLLPRGLADVLREHSIHSTLENLSKESFRRPSRRVSLSFPSCR